MQRITSCRCNKSLINSQSTSQPVSQAVNQSSKQAEGRTRTAGRRACLPVVPSRFDCNMQPGLKVQYGPYLLPARHAPWVVYICTVATEHTTPLHLHPTTFQSPSPPLSPTHSSTSPLHSGPDTGGLAWLAGWVGLGRDGLCVSLLCSVSIPAFRLHSAYWVACTLGLACSTSKQQAASSLHHAACSLHPASKDQSCSDPGRSCSLCDCCVRGPRGGLQSCLPGIPPQLSGRPGRLLAALVVVLCLVCCYIISTRFCRPAHCDLLTLDTPAKAATKHNPAAQHASTFQSPSPPPARSPPARSLPPAPAPRHPRAGPPLSAESSTRLPESLPIWGCHCPAPSPSWRGLPCRPCLARSFSPCPHCLASKLI